MAKQPKQDRAPTDDRVKQSNELKALAELGDSGGDRVVSVGRKKTLKQERKKQERQKKEEKQANYEFFGNFIKESGYRVGDSVYSLYSHSKQQPRLEIGDCGRILGPSTSSPDRICCEFPGWPKVNMQPQQIVSPATYAENQVANRKHLRSTGLDVESCVVFIGSRTLEWNSHPESFVEPYDEGVVVRASGKIGFCICDFPNWTQAHVMIEELEDQRAYAKRMQEQEKLAKQKELQMKEDEAQKRRDAYQANLETLKERGGYNPGDTVYVARMLDCSSGQFGVRQPKRRVNSTTHGRNRKCKADDTIVHAGTKGVIVEVLDLSCWIRGGEDMQASSTAEEDNMPVLTVKMLGGRDQSHEQTLKVKPHTDILSVADWNHRKLAEAQEHRADAHRAFAPLLAVLQKADDDPNSYSVSSQEIACKEFDQIDRSESLLGRVLLDMWYNTPHIGMEGQRYPPYQYYVMRHDPDCSNEVLFFLEKGIQIGTGELPWSAETVGDASKRELVTFMQTKCSAEFLSRHKLNGKVMAIAKSFKAAALQSAYIELLADPSLLHAATNDTHDTTDTEETAAHSKAKVQEFRERLWDALCIAGHDPLELIGLANAAVEPGFGISDRDAFSALACSEIARGSFAGLDKASIQRLADLAARGTHTKVFEAVVSTWAHMGLAEERYLRCAVTWTLTCAHVENPESTTAAFVKMFCKLPGAQDLSANSYETSLHIAADNDLCDVAHTILAETSSAGVNMKNRNGDTALHLACARSNREMVKVLLSHGANPDVINKKAKKPQALLSGSAAVKKAIKSQLLAVRAAAGPQNTSPVRSTQPRNSPQRGSVGQTQMPEPNEDCAQTENIDSSNGQVTEVRNEEDNMDTAVDAAVTVLTGERRLVHIRQLIADLIVDEVPRCSTAHGAEPDWVSQMRDGIVPGEEVGENENIDNGHDNATLEDFSSAGDAQGDYAAAFNWTEMLYEFEITREASNQLSRLDPPLKRAAMNRMSQVGRGIWSPRLWHRLSSGVPPQLELYSTSFMSQYRVLWELSPEYSSATRTPRETIKIWYVGPHKGYEHRIDDVVRCFKEGRTCIPEMRKRFKRQKGGGKVVGGIRVPCMYTVDETDRSDSIPEEAAPDQTMADSREHCPPAEVVDDSRTLVKFYQLNEAFCSLVLKGILSEKLQFPFKTDQLEDDIINQKRDKALLLVGRSGTGKTTISMNRMWIAWQRFHATTEPQSQSHSTSNVWNSVFVTANPVLVHAVRDVFRNMQLAYEGSGVEILPEKADIPLSLHSEMATPDMFPMFVSSRDWLLLLDSTVCSDDLAAKKQRCDDARQAHAEAVVNRQCVLDAQTAAKKKYADAEAQLMHMNMVPSERSRQLKIMHHELVDDAVSKAREAHSREQLCSQALLRAQQTYDSPETAKPFIQIASKEERDGHQAGMLGSGGTLTELLQQKDDHAAGSSGQQSVPSRTEVDAIMFERDFWGICSCTQGYAASTVWTEIASYIKGSMQSLQSNSGHLSRQDYTRLGQKIGSFGNPDIRSDAANREGVYAIFQEYEAWKRGSDRYDRMDLVHDIYRRVMLIGYKGAPIHAMSIDEVQDFTQAELCLYLRVVRDPNDMLLAGDTCQTIARGVGFRFEDLRLMFHEMKNELPKIQVPRLTPLAVNYRTHNGILGAAGEVVAIIQKMFPGCKLARSTL
eukprot:COSAG02_NODE_888_length_16167_cov_293.783234_10_plen_1677_part_00